jgi:DHA1 family multidrug resistance protein-like MFS transporter
MLLRAMTAAAILLALMGLVTSPWLLLGLRMLQGALTGTVFAAQALVAAAAPEKETGRAIGLLQMSVFVGATFGPIGGGAAAELLGFRMSYLFAGTLIALATAVVFIFVWEPEHQQARRERDAAAPSMRSVLAIPAFAVALSLVLISNLAGTVLFPVLPLFVQDLLHTTRNVATSTGWLMAASGLTAGAGSYLAGRLHRRLPMRPLLIGVLILTSLLFVPLAFVQSFTALLIVRCVGAAAYGALVSLVGTVAATSSPSNAKGTAFGMMGAASSLGFGAGPLLGGALAAGWGIRPVFLVSAGLLAFGPLVMLGIAKLALFMRRSLPTPARLLAERDR